MARTPGSVFLKKAAIRVSKQVAGSKKPWRDGQIGELRDVAKASYEAAPPATIGNDLKLVRSTKTLKIYRRGNTNQYVAGVRGTYDARDVGADVALSAGFLRQSARYKADRADLDKFLKEHPDAKITTTGHSLGGAVARQLDRDFAHRVSSAGVGFNSAIGLDELRDPRKLRATGQTRISSRYDILRLISTPFLKKKDQPAVVAGSSANPLKAHQMSSFDALNNGT